MCGSREPDRSDIAKRARWKDGPAAAAWRRWREKVVRAAVKRGQTTLLAEALRTNKCLTARDVGEAAALGDALAIRIVRSTGRRLGEGLAVLVDILNPERIVIGGLALRLGDLLLEPARRVVLREAISSSASVCRIVPASLGEQIGDVAALCVAMGL